MAPRDDIHGEISLSHWHFSHFVEYETLLFLSALGNITPDRYARTTRKQHFINVMNGMLYSILLLLIIKKQTRTENQIIHSLFVSCMIQHH